ncbi:MAG: hypothetical protein KC609_23120 [Myxococcales bacterium]|nr:hypothetical protein [Myxococcales bacterium]
MKLRAPHLAAVLALLLLAGSGLFNAGCKSTTEVIQADASGDTGNADTSNDTVIGTQYTLILDQQDRKMVGLSEDFLKVQYLEDGVPKDGVDIVYTLDTADSSVAVLQVTEATTANNGFAQVKISVGSGPATFTVTVQDKAKLAAPKKFTIEIVPKEQAELTVKLEYDGVRNNAQLAEVQVVEVYIYKKGGEYTTCDKFDFATATAKKLKSVPSQPLIQSPIPDAAFAGFQQADYGEYLVFGVGKNADGYVLAQGCLDTGAAVGTQPVVVTLVLGDVLPNYVGKYNMSLELDLLSALKTVNKTAYDVVDTIITLFSDPTGAVLKLTCKIDNDTLDSVCDALYDCADAVQPDKMVDCQQLTDTVWTSVGSQFLNALIGNLIGRNPLLSSIVNVGAAISEMIKGIKMNGVLEITQQPTPMTDKLQFPDGSINVSFTGISYKWYVETTTVCTQASDCPQSQGYFCLEKTGDNVCAQIQEGTINSSLISGSPFIAGMFKAYVKDLYDFYLEEGPVNLNYGTIINAILEKVVLKQFAGVDSYENFIKELLGGSGCSSNPQVDCCEEASKKLLADSDLQSLASVIKAACNTLIGVGGKYLRDQLNGLTLSSASDAGCGAGLCLSSPTGVPCKLFDTYGNKTDNEIDYFGEKSNPCLLNATIKVENGSTTVPFDVRFTAVRQGIE